MAQSPTPTALFFVAFVLPTDVSLAVVKVQQELSSRFHTHRSLRVVPHITLKAPFTIPLGQVPEVGSWFAKFTTAETSFPIHLNGFGSFPRSKNPVIFIKPEGPSALYQLQQELLKSFCATFPDIAVHPTEKGFSPHVTVAYRDLEPDYFEVAWAEFRNRAFEADVQFDRFSLLQHDGKKWNVLADKTLAS